VQRRRHPAKHHLAIVWVANCCSGRDRRLKQATTMLAPSVAIKGSGSRG
jgi:hypothetical protein